MKARRKNIENRQDSTMPQYLSMTMTDTERRDYFSPMAELSQYIDRAHAAGLDTAWYNVRAAIMDASYGDYTTLFCNLIDSIESFEKKA
jgi:hypothetical protein